MNIGTELGDWFNAMTPWLFLSPWTRVVLVVGGRARGGEAVCQKEPPLPISVLLITD